MVDTPERIGGASLYQLWQREIDYLAAPVGQKYPAGLRIILPVPKQKMRGSERWLTRRK